MFYRRRRTQSGQGIVEYILITALTAIATVAIFRTFRADITLAYKKAGEALIQGVEEGTNNGSSLPPTP